MTTPREIIAEAYSDMELNAISADDAASAIIDCLTIHGIHLMTDADLAARDDAVKLESIQKAALAVSVRAVQFKAMAMHHEQEGDSESSHIAQCQAIAVGMAASDVFALKGGRS